MYNVLCEYKGTVGNCFIIIILLLLYTIASISGETIVATTRCYFSVLEPHSHRISFLYVYMCICIYQRNLVRVCIYIYICV